MGAVRSGDIVNTLDMRCPRKLYQASCHKYPRLVLALIISHGQSAAILGDVNVDSMFGPFREVFLSTFYFLSPVTSHCSLLTSPLSLPQREADLL